MYRLVLLHQDDVWAHEVEAEVRGVVRRTVQRDDVLVTCSIADARADPFSPTVVLYLASEAARDDATIRTLLDEARAAVFPVLPVGKAEADLHRLLPPSIRRLNAVIWDGSRNQGVQIARLLGIVESDRKLFLSYRRTDSEALAVQLCRSLSERGYDVFLDRFSVPPAADFQDRLDVELADKAFVVLLESASAVGSAWVQHEVSYALAHHIAVLALMLPDAEPDGRFAVVDDAFRLTLAPGDLAGGPGAERVLRDEALRRVLDEIELQAARQLRRRREQLFGGMSDFLFAAGAGRTPVDSWALLAQRDGSAPEVLLVTPRAPTPFDVRSVDLLRVAAGLGDCRGRVVHDVADSDIELRRLIEWIISGRPLDVISLQQLADELMA